MKLNAHSQPSFDPAYAVWVNRGSDFGSLLKSLATQLVVRPARLARTWWQRYQERSQLLVLDEAILRDIGLTRADAVGRWRKGFWHA